VYSCKNYEKRLTYVEDMSEVTVGPFWDTVYTVLQKKEAFCSNNSNVYKSFFAVNILKIPEKGIIEHKRKPCLSVMLF